MHSTDGISGGRGGQSVWKWAVGQPEGADWNAGRQAETLRPTGWAGPAANHRPREWAPRSSKSRLRWFIVYIPEKKWSSHKAAGALRPCLASLLQAPPGGRGTGGTGRALCSLPGGGTALRCRLRAGCGGCPWDALLPRGHQLDGLPHCPPCPGRGPIQPSIVWSFHL